LAYYENGLTRGQSRENMPNRPVICGKCGTSDRTMISTYQGFAQGSPKLMQVICRDCGHEAKANSVVAALAKFEEQKKN